MPVLVMRACNAGLEFRLGQRIHVVIAHHVVARPVERGIVRFNDLQVLSRVLLRRRRILILEIPQLDDEIRRRGIHGLNEVVHLPQS
jgi:hypothetical protein